MSNRSIILLGTLIVAGIGLLSGVTDYPEVYSPWSMAVVIPTVIASDFYLPESPTRLLGILPLGTFYLIWSLVFIKTPYRIVTPTTILAICIALFSIAFNLSGYEEGIKYQGYAYTLIIYSINLGCIGLLALIYKHNKSNPAFISSLFFNITLFSWLGWVAFPWQGGVI